MFEAYLTTSFSKCILKILVKSFKIYYTSLVGSYYTTCFIFRLENVEKEFFSQDYRSLEATPGTWDMSTRVASRELRLIKLKIWSVIYLLKACRLQNPVCECLRSHVGIRFSWRQGSRWWNVRLFFNISFCQPVHHHIIS